MQSSSAPNPSAPKGIGGWLILLAIFICATPGQLIIGVEQAAREYAQPETATFIAKSPLWRAIKVCDVEVSMILILLSFVAIPLFFIRHKRFPSYGIFLFASIAISSAVKAYLIHSTGITNPEVSSIIATCVIASIKSALWISYLIKSERVQNTFTRRIHIMPAAPYVSLA